jgi:capsular polysaccharide transport system permease protein
LVWFVLAVVIPAIVSAVYFFGIAANMYVSEFYAVVRPASDQQDGGPVSRSAVNEQTAVQSNVVVEYIKSPELVSKLEDEIGLRTIYSTDKADFWSRLDPHASMETLVAYWNSMVQPFFDMTTGTVSVGVKAFDAADAQLIATQVIHLSEDLVNSMSQRARADAVRSDEEEVHKAGDQLAKIRQQMLEFRNQQQMIDPKAEATSSLSLISHLREELALAQANLDSYGEATEAPGAKVLRLRIVALQRQIAAASSSITSSDRQSKTNALSANVTSFEELDTKRQVAEKYYDAALSALERAQYDASRQASYLAVFVEPNLPQTPAYPKRVMSVMLTLLASLGVWIFGIVIFQSIREHV